MTSSVWKCLSIYNITIFYISNPTPWYLNEWTIKVERIQTTHKNSFKQFRSALIYICSILLTSRKNVIKKIEQSLSVIFNETCQKKNLVLKHTHTHTHTYIYTYTQGYSINKRKFFWKKQNNFFSQNFFPKCKLCIIRNWFIAKIFLWLFKIVANQTLLQDWTEIYHQFFGGWEVQTMWNLQKTVWCYMEKHV